MNDYLVLIYEKDTDIFVDCVIITTTSEKSVCKKLKKYSWTKNKSYDIIDIQEVGRLKKLRR